MAPLWLQIAKNEIKLWTSKFRNHRILFFSILIAFLGTYAFLLVPLVFNALSAPIYAFLDGQPNLPIFLYFVFSFAVLYVFIWCVTYPSSFMLQSTDDLSGQLEILLATPLRPQDILFGKFVGRLPIYLIVLFMIAPWIVNFFLIIIPLSIIGQFLIYMVFFVVVVLGMWLGTLLASYVESKVRNSEKSRDLAKTFVLIITISTSAMIYVIIWVVMAGLSDPTSPLYFILQGFPSTWGAFIIMGIFGFGEFVPIHIGLFIALLLGLTLALLYFGFHGAGRFYSLEPAQTQSEQITSERRFYRFIRRIIPGNFGVLVLSQLKQYSRKMENFSRIGYAVGISAMVIVFNLAIGGGQGIGIGFYIMFSTFMYSMMIAMMLGCFVIIGSKDNLWIYKKGPNGVSKFVWSVYLVNLIYTIPIGVIFATAMTIVLGFSILEGLFMVFLSITYLITLMALAIGLSFIFPTFEERGGKLGILMMSAIGISMGILIVSGIIGIGIFGVGNILAWPLSALLFSTIAGFGLLMLGIKKLSTLE